MVGLIEVIVLVLLLATAGGRLLGVRLPLRRALIHRAARAGSWHRVRVSG